MNNRTIGWIIGIIVVLIIIWFVWDWSAQDAAVAPAPDAATTTTQ
ncbi:hypothetical protein [Consotaella aegiceratis]